MAATVSVVSKEYLHGPVTASVTLDTQVVEVAFLAAAGKPDGSTTWKAAEWEGTTGSSRSWRILIGPGTTAALAAGIYSVWVRITDSPEQPVRQHDNLTVQ